LSKDLIISTKSQNNFSSNLNRKKITLIHVRNCPWIGVHFKSRWNQPIVETIYDLSVPILLWFKLLSWKKI